MSPYIKSYSSTLQCVHSGVSEKTNWILHWAEDVGLLPDWCDCWLGFSHTVHSKSILFVHLKLNSPKHFNTISLVDIVGFLHFWNITIDVISCINIVLSIGLCVDYSVHIGHGYLVAGGTTRQERTNNAVVFIGPAVFNGGFTTFLALVLCSFSTGLQNWFVIKLNMIFKAMHSLQSSRFLLWLHFLDFSMALFAFQ